jgi:hypothetical protein
MIPIVASGKESHIQMTYERSVMEACLLENLRGMVIQFQTCYGSKLERFDKMNILLLVCMRDLHRKIKMTW